MKTSKEPLNKVAGIMRAKRAKIIAFFVVIISALISLGIYVRYINPTARFSDLSVSDALYILLCTVLGGLLGINIAFFINKMINRSPKLSRTLLLTFSLFTLCYLAVLPALHVYSPSPGNMISFLVIALLIWLAVNIFIYFRVRDVGRTEGKL